MSKMGKDRNSKKGYSRHDFVTERDVRANIRKGYGNGVYMLEKILEKRQTDQGKTMYLVKWVGFSMKENTWEPPKNIDPVSVREFEEDLVKKSGPNHSDTGPGRRLKRKRRGRASSSPDRSVSEEEEDEVECLTPKDPTTEVPRQEESESEPEDVSGQVQGNQSGATETNLERRVLHKITGLKERDDKFVYLVKFKTGQGRPFRLESEYMMKHYPIQTISFLEQYVKTNSPPQSLS